MIQSIFILNNTGDIIIEKNYRGLINRSICDLFWNDVAKIQHAGLPVSEVPPVIINGKYYMIHIQHGTLFFMSVVSGEVPPLLVLEFLHRVCDIFQEYFETKQLQEATIRNNFVTVYQLLDEMMDNGVPFTTEPNSLIEIIPAPNLLKNVFSGFTGHSQMSGSLPDGSLSNTPWRKQGVRYSSNEIYLDIIEEIDAVVEVNGLVVSCEVSAEVQANCKLSGMPDLTLTFNNPYILDDVSFHPCVRYNRYEQSKVVSFVPPDGPFKLMAYRVKGQLQIPIYVKPQINQSNGGRVSVIVGTKAIQDKAIEDVVITIPFAKAVNSVVLTTNMGSFHYDDITKVCKWTIGKISKDKNPSMEGTVQLSSGSPIPDTNPILSAQFKVMMYAASGLKVESLSLHNEHYKPYKGVRMITKAGKFYVRS